MRKLLAWLRYSLCAAGMVAAIAGAAQTRRLIFLSTQLRPIEEAQKMRNVILKDFQRDVDYVPERPQLFPVRIDEALQQGTPTRSMSSARCTASCSPSRDWARWRLWMALPVS